MRKKLYTVLIVFAVMSALGIVLNYAGKGNSSSQNAAGMFQRPPAPVAVATSISRDVPVYLDEIGKCVALEMVSVQPQVGGRIVSIHFRDGADVKKGDTLFIIDPRPFHASLSAAQADLAQSKSALNLAKVNFERSTTLLRQNLIAQADYDNAKNAIESAQAQVEKNQAAVENAKLNLDYCYIRSPINGRAGRHLVDPGNIVVANSTSNNSTLLTIQKMEPIYADFTINENELATVRQFMSHGPLPVEIHIPNQPDSSTEKGTLTFLDNSVQSSTGTVSLRAQAPNTGRRLWPGQFVNVRIILNVIHNAVLIPAASTQMSAKGPIIYVLGKDTTAELRPVTVGQRQGDLVVITKGVNAGEQVVTSGQLAVTPGGKVRPITGSMAEKQ